MPGLVGLDLYGQSDHKTLDSNQVVIYSECVKECFFWSRQGSLGPFGCCTFGCSSATFWRPESKLPDSETGCSICMESRPAGWISGPSCVANRSGSCFEYNNMVCAGFRTFRRRARYAQRHEPWLHVSWILYWVNGDWSHFAESRYLTNMLLRFPQASLRYYISSSSYVIQSSRDESGQIRSRVDENSGVWTNIPGIKGRERGVKWVKWVKSESSRWNDGHFACWPCGLLIVMIWWWHDDIMMRWFPGCLAVPFINFADGGSSGESPERARERLRSTEENRDTPSDGKGCACIDW